MGEQRRLPLTARRVVRNCRQVELRGQRLVSRSARPAHSSGRSMGGERECHLVLVNIVALVGGVVAVS
jgi:hypothetical protein